MSAIFAQAVENATCPQCGAPLQGTPLGSVACGQCHQNVLVPGKLGQYRLTTLLGKGGMGAVYEGIDEGLQRKVAVKVILREKVDEDPTFLENFRREAQAAAKLNHPNIVAVYAFGEYEAQPFLAMELVRHNSLDRMIAQGAVLPGTALSIGYQIAQGLKAAADQGLVHGDVKPENILINEAHEAKLADFGIAALMGKSSNNEVWGTPYYIAPETLLKKKVDYRADIYSLGGTIYHAIAGVPPFEGADAVAVMKARLEHPPRDLRELAPSCPEGIAKIVMRMLESEPMRRYPNYDSLLSDMRKEVAASKTQTGMSKRIVIKGKSTTQRANLTQSIQLDRPSKPMPSIALNAPLQPKNQGGLSKGAIIGIFGGIAAIFLLIIVGAVVALIHVNKPKEKPQPTAAQLAAEAPAPVIVSHEIQDLTLKTAEEAQSMAKDVEQVNSIITQLKNRAQPMLFPEEELWLTPQDGEEKPPREILSKLQDAFAIQAKMDEAAKTWAELAKALAAFEEETPENIEKAKAMVKEATSKVKPKQFSTQLTTLKRMLRTWESVVDNARREKNQKILDQREADRQAKIAAAKEAEKERQKAELEKEVARARGLRDDFVRDIDNFRLEQAVKDYAERVKQLKSTEARRAAQVGAEQLEALLTVKQWLIENAQKGRLKPYKVTKATEDTVTFNGQSVEWKTLVSNKKTMVSIIRGLAASEYAPRVSSDVALGLRQFMLHFFTPDEISGSKTLTDMMQRLKDRCNERMLERLEGSSSDAASDSGSESYDNE